MDKKFEVLRQLTNVCINNKLFETGKVGTFILENSYGYPIVHCSKSFQKLLKLENTNTQLISLMDEDSKERFTKKLLKYKKGKEEHWIFEKIKLIRTDGKYLITELHIVPVKEENKTKYLVGYLIDITEEEEEKNLIETVSRLAPVCLCMYKDRKIIYANEKVKEITGYSLKELQNLDDVFTIIHPEDREEALKKLEEIKEGKSLEKVIRVITKDKKIKWLHIVSSAIEYKQERYFISIAEDITKHIKTEAFKKLLFDINKAVITANEVSDLIEAICKLINEASYIKAGFIFSRLKYEPLCKKNTGNLDFNYFLDNLYKILPKDKVLYIKNVQKSLLEKKLKEFLSKKGINSLILLKLEYKALSYDLVLMFEETNFIETKEDVEIFKEIKEDIEFALDHIFQQKKLLVKEYFDELVGIGNRNLFMQRIKNLKRENKKFTVFLLDIYHFRHINETYGKEFGDKVLRYLAKTLDKVLLEEDVFRVGFDEFAIVSTEKSPYQVLEKIKEVLKEINIDNIKLSLDYNIGVISYPEDEEDLENLVLKVERVLDISRSKGKNKVEFYSKEEYEKLKTTISIEEEIEKAIKNDEFILYLQPVVSTKDNSVYGAEALIRWRKPDGTIVPPYQFIPVAEQTGQIKDIDLCVLLKAKHIIEEIYHNANKKLNISVNITPSHIDHLIEFFEGQTLPKCKLKTDFDFSKVLGNITFELTEREGFEVYESKEKIEKIKKLGFKVSIDDFGTGYSSLSYLINLDVDFIKIDMSFTQKFIEDIKVYKLVKSIIDIAKTFNIKTIAEGVETEEQLKQLKELGCDFYQGYLFSPPIPEDEFIKMFDKR